MVNPAVPAGSVTNIVTQGITMPDDGNNIIDIAVAPTSTKLKTPPWAAGPRLTMSFPGFSGTGYVSLGSGVAGGFVEFSGESERTGGILPHLRQWE